MRQYRLTVTSKGQVTLPAGYRKAAGIETGSTLNLVVDDSGMARLRKTLSLSDIAGSLTHGLTKDQRNFTQDDIDASVDEAMNAQAERASGRRR